MGRSYCIITPIDPVWSILSLASLRYFEKIAKSVWKVENVDKILMELGASSQKETINFREIQAILTTLVLSLFC